MSNSFSHNKLLLYFGAGIIALGISQMILGTYYDLHAHRAIPIFIALVISSYVRINLKSYNILLINIFIFIVAFFNSTQTYVNALSDIQKIVWWLPFSIFYSSILTSSDKRKLVFTKTLTQCIALAGVPLALLSLMKFRDLQSGVYWKELFYQDSGSYIMGTSLNFDYNVFAFGLAIITLAAKYLFEKEKRAFFKLLFIVQMLLNLYLMFFSGSRRAFVMVLILSVILPTVKLRKLEHRMPRINIKSNFRVAIIGTALVVLTSGLIGFFKSSSTSNKAFGQVINRLATTEAFLESDNTRTSRWTYSIDYFSSYSIPEMVFGDGFNYLTDFANYFYVKGEDHPHNFILSAFLYAGVIGAIHTIYMVGKILFMMIPLRFSRFFTFSFILVVILHMTSSNSIYSQPITIFFLVVMLKAINSKPQTQRDVAAT